MCAGFESLRARLRGQRRHREHFGHPLLVGGEVEAAERRDPEQHRRTGEVQAAANFIAFGMPPEILAWVTSEESLAIAVVMVAALWLVRSAHDRGVLGLIPAPSILLS